MKIGIVKETKNPPDKRVPLSPENCEELKATFPTIELVVQSSDIRAFKDSEYTDLGIDIVSDVSDCDVLLGVKEVKKDRLLANKTYFFFSHTIKEQPYNRDLLNFMLKKNIKMVDYETLTYPKDGRILGFGRYAGIVGAFNAFLAFGVKSGDYSLKPANECHDYKELKEELKKVKLPNDYKIIISGDGRVGKGAEEVLHTAGIYEVSPTDFLTSTRDEPIYTQLSVKEYNKRKDGAAFTKGDLYTNPELFESDFKRFSDIGNMYIACHYWDADAPFIFSREDAKSPDFKLKIVADISCDIDGPVASTIRPSTIDKPLYGYDPQTESEVDFMTKNAIGVMAVDNLPCELPRDASEDFGNELITKVLPSLINEDSDTIIERATICENGKLTSYFSYLQDYVDGKN
ncbi:NAD(P)-dependent oxidoreductase [Flavobacteriales bacterium]|nr:NAD(P)-dependent oxidoreductase [Flavobacteriales bacterium]|tara:strand:- start:1306 stop:2514 length:1209 start_codon:yes stop_codon:yes gene_type:complete